MTVNITAGLLPWKQVIQNFVVAIQPTFDTQRVVPRPAVSASPLRMLERQTLKPHLRAIESEFKF